MTGYGLHIVASTHRPPRATYTCPCGHTERAHGTDRVTDLVKRHKAGQHTQHCPLRTETGQEAA